jgi:hypothetical protein
MIYDHIVNDIQIERRLNIERFWCYKHLSAKLLGSVKQASSINQTYLSDLFSVEAYTYLKLTNPHLVIKLSAVSLYLIVSVASYK